MKHLLTTAALAVIIFSTPNVRASSTKFDFTSGDAALTDNNGVFTLSLGALGSIVFTGYSCPYICSLTPNLAASILPFGLTDINGALGLSDGIGNETAIPRNDFVIVDFTNYTGPLSSVTLNTTDVFDGWDIYSTSQPNQLDSSTDRGPVPLAQGNNTTDYSLAEYPNINSSIAQFATSGSSTFGPTTEYVSVTALQAVCEGCPQVEISSITLTDVVPEPVTLVTVLSGAVLLSLGLFGKRRRESRRNSSR